MNFYNVQKSISSPKFSKLKITENQSTNDIIKLILSGEYLNREDFNKIATNFRSGSKYDSCKKVFDFCKINFPYRKESNKNQTVKSVSRMLHDRFSDCKNLSVFCVGTLNAMGIDSKFRFCSYDTFDKNPTHVYCIANINGREVIIDPVMDSFDNETSYKSKFDISPIKKKNKMALNYLSGIGKGGKGKKKFKAAFKKVTKSVAKVGLSPARNAFLLILKVNGLGLAKKLLKGYKKNPAALQKMWEKFGGDFKSFKKNLATGSKAKISGEEMGFVLATAAASATPVLIAAYKFLKESGVLDKKESAELEAGIQQGKELLAKDESVEKGTSEMSKDSDVKVEKGEGMFSFLDNIPMPVKIVGGAALAFGAYKLATRKK